jgi:hypothetical protein
MSESKEFMLVDLNAKPHKADERRADWVGQCVRLVQRLISPNNPFQYTPERRDGDPFDSDEAFVFRANRQRFFLVIALLQSEKRPIYLHRRLSH